MGAEFLIQESGSPGQVSVKSEGRQVGEIRPEDAKTYTLNASDGRSWTLSPRVHGEVRPFSMTVARAEGGRTGDAILTIRNHLFLHGRRFYLVGGIPRERAARDFLHGTRFICRLDNFPFSNLVDVDHETWSRLRRFRGEPVGEFEGLGKGGHTVKIAAELSEIGLPLAAACYMLYSSA